MRDILKMIGVLSLICGLSGLTLATLKDATQQKIEEQVLIYVQKPSIEAVLSGFDNDPIKDRAAFEVPGTREKVVVFPAMAGGKLAGLAFETSAPGYGGDSGQARGHRHNHHEGDSGGGDARGRARICRPVQEAFAGGAGAFLQGRDRGSRCRRHHLFHGRVRGRAQGG